MISQRDIVLLPYPYTDFQGSKVRPAVVISNEAFNRKSDDCVMVPLTSILKNEPYSVFITQENLESGSLIKPSRIRADKIFSVTKKLIITKIGVLDERTFKKIKSELMTIF